ncbi:MAG: FtsH protease activity modulator HflK [Methyloligellaceae bacterium]
MPWNNQNGGGGWKGGGGGPWGQGPQGGGSGGGGGNKPPDLEDLLKRSQDKFKQAMPGGGGGLIWLIVIVAALGIWAANSFYTIQPDERGVVKRFGKYHKTYIDGGLKFVIWPIDTLTIVKFTSQNTDTFPQGRESVMLSGDLNLVDISFTVLWRVTDAQQYLFETQAPDRLVRIVADSAIREIVARTPAEKVRTTDKNVIRNQVKDIIQKTLDRYKSGILIRDVVLNAVAPPEEVKDAFQDVQKAKQDKSKSIQEANKHRETVLGQARGGASKQVEDAKGGKAKVVAEAEGEAKRFLSVYEQYAKAKDVTRKWLYLNTIQDVLSNANKVIIEQNGKSGVVPYLPLSELNNQRRGGQ